MRAGFSDPQGPLRWRVLPYAVVLPPLLFALCGPLGDVLSTLLAVGSFALFHFIGLVDWRPKGPRSVELDLGPGYVVVREAGTRDQRIAFEDITGATTARTETGYLLSLDHRKRKRPLTLTLETEADVEAVRRLLGIGHDGFGVVSWQTEARSEDRIERLACIFFGVVALLLIPILSVTAGMWQPDAVLLPLVISVAFVLLFSTVARFISLFDPYQRGISMTARGLDVRTQHESKCIPYANIADVQAHDEAVALLVHPPGAKPPASSFFVRRASPRWGGLSEYDAGVMVAQIRAASHRAHGFGTAKHEVASRLDVLRPNGQSMHEWLMRLDVTAQMLEEGSGYRGTTLDPDDLWAVLEDPDADSLLRTAAARILRHRSAPSTRLRIDTTLAAVRDPETSERLRIAVDEDLETASRQLAELDPSPSAEEVARIEVE